MEKKQETKPTSSEPIVTSNIYTKIFHIQRNIFVKKGKVAFQGRYNYRSCDDIYTALKKIGAEYGVLFIATEEIVRLETVIQTTTINKTTAEVKDSRTYIKSTITAYCIDTGTSIQCSSLARESFDRSGLDVAQITGSATSYARKYALSSMLNLDDTEDPDAFENEDTNEKTNKGIPQAPAKKIGSITGKIPVNPTVNAHRVYPAPPIPQALEKQKNVPASTEINKVVPNPPINRTALHLLIKTLVNEAEVNKEQLLMFYKVDSLEALLLLPEETIQELNMHMRAKVSKMSTKQR